MPDMQRTGGVRADEFDQHAVAAKLTGMAEARALFDDLIDEPRDRARRETKINETGPGDFRRRDQWRRWNLSGDTFRNGERVELEWLGELERQAGSPVAMLRIARQFERRLGRFVRQRGPRFTGQA